MRLQNKMFAIPTQIRSTYVSVELKTLDTKSREANLQSYSYDVLPADLSARKQALAKQFKHRADPTVNGNQFNGASRK